MTRLILFLSSILLFGCNEKPQVSEGTLWYDTPKVLAPFVLEDQVGEEIDNMALEGKWSLLFLGYTSCPDICPMTLMKLKQVHEAVSDEIDVQVWFVSVDPKRDDTAKRKAYIDHFNPSFLAVSAEHKQLFPFVRNLGLVYAINDETNEKSYYVDHSASVALVNPKGQLESIFKPTFEPGQVPTINTKHLIEDLKKITY